MNLQIALMVLLAETSREIIGKTPEQCGCTGPASALWLQQQPPKYLNRFTLISGNEILTMEQQMLSTSLARRMFRSRFPEAGFTDERIMSALAPLRTELN